MSNTSYWDLHNSKEDLVTHPLVLKYYRQTMKTELGSNGVKVLLPSPCLWASIRTKDDKGALIPKGKIKPWISAP